MPATAGRVRMPANNRVHSSAALQTHGIWQSAIGYDPYAPNKDDSKNSAQPKASSNETEADNPYNSYQGLLALARITNTNVDDARGACKKCGRVGHLTFQCRNFLSAKEKDPEAIQAAVLSELDKIKGKMGKVGGKGKGEIEDGSDEDEEEEESDSSDSDADSEMERIIAARFGKKVNDKERSSRKKKRDNSDENVSDSDMDSGKRKKRGRSKSKKRSGKRGQSDSENEDDGKRKRREKRRNRDDSSDEENERRHGRRKFKKEKRRRRGHRHADDSDASTSEDSGIKYERKSRRSVTPSDFIASGSDDSRVGRGAKRSTKKSRKRSHRDYE